MNRIKNKINLNYDFKENKLINKYFKMITIPVIILVIIINIVVVFYYSYLFRNEIKEKQTEQLYQYKSEFEKTQRNIEIIFSLFLKNDSVKHFLSFDSLREVDSLETNRLLNNLSATLVDTALLNTGIDKIYICNFDMNYYISMYESGFLTESIKPKWYTDYISKNKNNKYVSMICSDNKITYYLETLNDDGEKGMIVFETELPKVIFDNSLDSSIFIVDGDKVIYSNKNEGIATYADVKNKYLSNNIIKNFSESYVILESTDREDYYYVSVRKDVYSNNNKLFILSFIVFSIAIMIFICFVLSIIFGKEVTNVAVSLMSVIDNPFGNVENYKLKEINYVLKTIFNKKEDGIDSLGKLLSQKMSALKNSQIIALQTQITPHFLYNTLQSINLTALRHFKGKNDVSEMVVLFSDILHNALDTETYIVSIRDELSYTKDYISLQNYKYPNRFETIWNVDDSVLDFKIVKFSLQPIIENALSHGIYLVNKKCTLTINILNNSDYIIIEVKNDGKPIDCEKLKEINELLENNDIKIKESRSIGLSNVNQRIKLIFGNDYGIKMSFDNGVTTTIINSPKISEL